MGQTGYTETGGLDALLTLPVTHLWGVRSTSTVLGPDEGPGRTEPSRPDRTPVSRRVGVGPDVPSRPSTGVGHSTEQIVAGLP